VAVLGKKEVAAPLERLPAARALPIVPSCVHKSRIRYVRQNENRRDFFIPSEEPEEDTYQHRKNKPARNGERKLQTESRHAALYRALASSSDSGSRKRRSTRGRRSNLDEKKATRYPRRANTPTPRIAIQMFSICVLVTEPFQS
jgi:hypothetical protein